MIKRQRETRKRKDNRQRKMCQGRRGIGEGPYNVRHRMGRGREDAAEVHRMYSGCLHLVERPLALVGLLSPQESFSKSAGGETLGDVGGDGTLLGAAEGRVHLHQVHGAEAVGLREHFTDVRSLPEGEASNLHRCQRADEEGGQ